MDIKLTFGHQDYSASLKIGDYNLRGIKETCSPSCCDRSNDKVTYSYLHPFPYMATIFLPSDMQERAAIVEFIKGNLDKIEKEYGLVFQNVGEGKSDFKGYEKECELLGVVDGDTKDDIRNKFRELSLKWHPDRWATASDEEKKTAEDKFKEIYPAYEKLTSINFYGCSMTVVDLNAKNLYYLHEDLLNEEKKERINSLRF